MELTDFIICDDIRMENTGKALLIGVYDDAINILKDPMMNEKKCAHLKLSFLARIASSTEDKETLPTRFEIDFVSRPQGQVLIKIVGPVNLKMPLSRIAIAGHISPIQLDYGTDFLNFEVRLFSAERQIAAFHPFPLSIKFMDQLPSS